MPDRELRRMRRAELVEIILALKQTEDRLRAENAALSAQLQERQIHIENAGSIAQAALELNKVFEAAQAAADEYNIREQPMKKNKSTIILILVFFVGLSVMLYPTISDYVNQLHQTRAVANYAADVDKLSDADYTAYFEAADAFNAQIAADPDALYFPDRFPSYESTLDVTGTGIMGYITIEKIGVELPIYHGTSDAVLQVAAGHLEGTSLPVGGASTHAVISAHRGLPSAKLFTNLDQLEVGDTFTITVLDRVLTYEVDNISIVLPTETDSLKVVDSKRNKKGRFMHLSAKIIKIFSNKWSAAAED